MLPSGVINDDRKSQTLFQTVPSPTPYGLLFPKIGGSQPQPKTSIAIISGTGKSTDFKFGCYIHRVHPNKAREKFWRKGSQSISRDCPNFLSTPIISERVKPRTTNFVRTFIGSIKTKAH